MTRLSRVRRRPDALYWPQPTRSDVGRTSRCAAWAGDVQRHLPRQAPQHRSTGHHGPGQTEDTMGCLFAIFAGAFPRLATLFIWLARPQLFAAAFGGAWIWPLLGILFLPFTTLMYVLLYTPASGSPRGIGCGWCWRCSWISRTMPRRPTPTAIACPTTRRHGPRLPAAQRESAAEARRRVLRGRRATRRTGSVQVALAVRGAGGCRADACAAATALNDRRGASHHAALAGRHRSARRHR